MFLHLGVKTLFFLFNICGFQDNVFGYTNNNNNIIQLVGYTIPVFIACASWSQIRYLNKNTPFFYALMHLGI